MRTWYGRMRSTFLIGSIVTVSLETVRIVTSLPALDIVDES